MVFMERRRFPRLNSRIPLQYKRAIRYKNALQGTITRNIGEGGVRFVAHEFIPLFIKLKVKMFLSSSSNSISALSKVIWVRKLPYLDRYDVGLEFIDLPDTGRKLIANYVSNKSKRSSFKI